MSDLRKRAIRLAYTNPTLRPHLLPILKSAEFDPEEIGDEEGPNEHDSDEHYMKEFDQGEHSELQDKVAGVSRVFDMLGDVLDGFHEVGYDERALLDEFVAAMSDRDAQQYLGMIAETGTGSKWKLLDAALRMKRKPKDVLYELVSLMPERTSMQVLKTVADMQDVPIRVAAESLTPSSLLAYLKESGDTVTVSTLQYAFPDQTSQQITKMVQKMVQEGKLEASGSGKGKKYSLPKTASRYAGCEKLPEGPMRDNCEEKKDEGGKDSDGKKAALRKATIRLAHANPALRPHLLPLLREASGYAIDFERGGLVEPGKIHLQEDTVYWMGASRSPQQIIVTGVSPDVVEYLLLDYHGNHKKRREQRWIAEDLIRSGSQAWLKSYGKWQPEQAESIRAMLAGRPGKKVNVRKFLDDRKRVEVTAVPAPAYSGQDLWRAAEVYGNVGGVELDDGRTAYEILMTKGSLRDLEKDDRFQIVGVRER